MRGSAARHDHSTQHLTDVRTRRVRVGAGEGYVAFGWDYPGSTLLEVKILRSEVRAARSAKEAPAEQLEVYRGVTGSYRDTQIVAGRTYFYTVFARHPGQREWMRWHDYTLAPRSTERRGWRAWLRLTRASRGSSTWLGAALLCVAAVAAATPSAAAAATAAKASSSSVASTVTAEATQIASGDARVASVLTGLASPKVKVLPWPGAGEAAGATVVYEWPGAEARSLAADWPLVKTGSKGQPLAPYVTVVHRVRITNLTALRVDVLPAARRVIRIAPADGATQFDLREETSPPFSWVPQLTAHPWVPLLVFLAVGLVVIVRAWRRSRAWNRRLPSMTRHDRQFIGRLIVILFLLAGLLWQILGAISAASAPAIDPGGFNAGALTALPLLLISPGIFVAAIVLEFSPATHRAAWGLVAVLAGAASAYNLATALTGTTTNLNLTYYILLGVLCLLAVPRAFSAGRMGWSRDSLSRLG